MGAVAGTEKQLGGWDDLLGLPGGSSGPVLLVKVRVGLEHDERLGRVDADVLRQAAGIQEFLPAGIAGVKDLSVGVCKGRGEARGVAAAGWEPGERDAGPLPSSPASCTCFTALVISALSASVSSAVTAAATGTTGRKEREAILRAPRGHEARQDSAQGIRPTAKCPAATAQGSPVSCVTAVAASASVASVTMSSEATVTMLSSLPSSGSRIFMPALPWCTVLTWERRLSTRLKPRPHLSQRNGFSPGDERGSRRLTVGSGTRGSAGSAGGTHRCG